MNQGKKDEAENYVDKGLMLDPNNFFGWNAKGVFDEIKGDKAAAIFDYKNSLKLKPYNKPALQALYYLEHPQ